MKKYFLLIILSCTSFWLCATVHTVSNNPSTIAQFSTIQAAIDAASSGDTIYIHGSPNTYPGITIDNKQLVLIGPGWSPDKDLPLIATIAGGTIFSGATTAGTEIHGLHFQNSISINTLGVNNLRFIRNRFTSLSIVISPSAAGTISGYLFEGNWFENAQVNSSSLYTIENFIFQNNLFFENGCCVSNNINGFTNSVNVLFDHNIFYGPGASTRNVFGNNTRFLTISNNIFVRRNASSNLSSSNFINNITFNSGVDNPWAVNGNIDGGSNLAGQDPQMADQAAVNSGTSNPLLDFTIASGPANNSASDGKDMGLLFDAAGSLNWLNSRNSRMPSIVSMNITTPTVAPGGNVSVTIESRSNN